MRRLVIIAVLAVASLGLAPAVIAGSPSHERTVETAVFDFAAGEFCDFPYHQTSTMKQNLFIFGDPAAPTRIVFQSQQRVTHTNVATGYTLTESAAISETFDPATAVDRIVGVMWHLRDADGKLVVVHAGQLIVDYSGEVPITVKATPHMDPSFEGVICTALWGKPA